MKQVMALRRELPDFSSKIFPACTPQEMKYIIPRDFPGIIF
jgi:hypothetical protein